MEILLGIKIKDLPKEIRPREKALRIGVDKLSDEELLAIIVASGIKNHSAKDIARELIDQQLDIANLPSITMPKLLIIPGISRYKALLLMAIFELYRRLDAKKESTILINPQDVYNRYKKYGLADKEKCLLIGVSSKRMLLFEQTIYIGTSEGILFSPKEIIRDVLLNNGRHFIVIHNHPDGQLFPSQDDIVATAILAKEARKFDLELLDHIIITKDGYFSFQEADFLKNIKNL